MARLVSISGPGTGLRLTLRAFKVEDEDILADKDLQKAGTSVSHLMRAVTKSVEDSGLYAPYPTDDEQKVVWWENVLQGERLHVLKENRIATWGPEFDGMEECPSRKCGETTEIPCFDLRTLKAKDLPATSFDHARNPASSPLKATLPLSGAVVHFRLLRAKDEKGLVAIKSQKKKAMSSGYLRFRVSAVEVNGEPIKGPLLESWIRDMEAQDSSYLRYAMDVADCGIDNETDLTCQKCGHSWRGDLTLNEGFLFPEYRPKKTAT